MRRVWAVLRREYLQRVRSRWFVFATLGIPLLLVASVAVPMWLSNRNEAAGRTIALIDLSGDVGDGVARALGEGGYTVDRMGPDEEAEARRRVEEGEDFDPTKPHVPIFWIFPQIQPNLSPPFRR